MAGNLNAWQKSTAPLKKTDVEEGQSLPQSQHRAGLPSHITILTLTGRAEAWSQGHIPCTGVSLLAPVLIFPSGLSSFARSQWPSSKIKETRCSPGHLGSSSPAVLGAGPGLRALRLCSFSFPAAGGPSKPSSSSGSALTHAASPCGPGCAKMSGFFRDLAGGS